MRPDEIIEELADIDEQIILADGYEDALIGYATIFNRTIALYDRAKCIDILIGQGMTEDEAEEYFQYNTEGAYVGEYTPAFATFLKGVEL